MTYTWREELAWAGGFWDGEGCTSLDKNNSAIAIVGQVDNEVESLHRFQNAVLGVGKINGPYRQSNRQHQPIFYWRAFGGAKVQAVIAMLWPFIGNIKKEQAARVLKAAKWRGEGMCQNNKHLIDPDWNQASGPKCEECYRDHYKRNNERRKAQRVARRMAVA